MKYEVTEAGAHHRSLNLNTPVMYEYHPSVLAVENAKLA
jgi:hypothetical protein